MAENEIEFVYEPDTGLDVADARQFSEAVLHSADWTVETIVSQLTRGNIDMNPRFQRRDAWSVRRKSAFIESLVLGLPVPQIVLAEKKGQRGKYIVLDGKQRLLSLLQFTGHAEGERNGFRLSGLEARGDLDRKSFEALQVPAFESDLNAFLNYTIRTVVIRNWPSYDFLHLVFLRLNTGSVRLSPQELRQAMFPGEFSNYIDDATAESRVIQSLLSRDGPDPRMRDVELLVRFLAFNFYLTSYGGRMKDFLDGTCERLNAGWDDQAAQIRGAISAFELATAALMDIMGADKVARKPGSRSFNRAIFDALVFFAANGQIRDAMLANPDQVKVAYEQVLEDPAFIEASESDTAGIPNTLTRLSVWGQKLRQALGLNFQVPTYRPSNAAEPHSKAAILFSGFGV